MGKKSRHYRDESDPLLGFYHRTLAATSSVRNQSNPLYDRSSVTVPSIVPLSLSAGTIRKKPSTIEEGDQSGDSPSNDNSASSPRRSSYRLSAYRRQESEVSTLKSGGEIPKRKQRKERYRVHRVSYTAQNHVQVLFRMYGSAFPNVLPFCLANITWTFFVQILKEHASIDLTFHSSVGHSFMGLLVSFLIVSRSRISYDRFMEYRKLLTKTYRACRELAQYTTVYSFEKQTAKAREWRQEVCFRTILLLRVTMDALLWGSTEREKWEDEYFQYNYKLDSSRARRSRGDVEAGRRRSRPELDDDDDGDEEDVSEHFFQFRKLSHGRRSMIDENYRAPISFSHLLELVIMQHPDYLGYKLQVNEYRDLLNFVTIFNDAFHGFRVLTFTPYPFPLVQMTRAFLLFWVFTLPMVLLKEYRLWSSLLIVTLVTFGFVGIEYVSMALDDPFGDDTNDVDEHGMALLVYEDIYLAIYRTDGPKAAFQLRERVLARYKQGRGLDCYRDDMKAYDIWEPLRHLQQQEEPVAETSHKHQQQNGDADHLNEKKNRKSSHGKPAVRFTS